MNPSPWSPYRPGPSAPWDLARVWTLRRRSGFAATWNELQRDLKDGPEAALNRVLAGNCRTEGVPADFATTADLLGDAAAGSSDAHRLQACWLYRMLFTPDPLAERLTLLWHNHFATSQLKQETARALTGRSVNQGHYAFRPDWHDDGAKTILRTTGRFDGVELVNVLLDQPTTAHRLAWRLCQAFLGENVADGSAVAELADESEAVAHSTVQALLRQLEVKGAVGHDAEDRTFAFFPRLNEDKVKRTAVREMLDRIFGGNVGNLVAHLLKGERLSRDELDELHRLIDQHRKS